MESVHRVDRSTGLNVRMIVQHGYERAREKRLRALSLVARYGGLPLAVAFLAACSSDEPAGDRPSSTTDNHPPVVKSVMILPTPVVLSGPVTASVSAQDIDGQNVQYRYRWLVNGEVIVGQTAASLPREWLKQGDQVVVEVTPFDGVIEGALFRSAAASVANTAPIIAHLSVGYDLDAQASRIIANAEVIDPDQDPVTVTYRWIQNDKVVKEGEDNTVDVAGLTSQDPVQVEVMASDGKHQDTTTVKGQFLIANALPTIVSQPPAAPTGGHYAYHVQATDPDGDSLTYALESAPPGMTIDAQTGQINWVPSPDTKGSHAVRIVAKDTKGGFASQEFELSLSTPAPPPQS